jgi:phosphoribosyl 1,2-cyclic phosphodiesterase
MKIVILGSGTGYPSPRREPSGLLIRVGNVPLLFDAGSGTLGRLARVGADLATLEHVHFTHQHSDHCADLIPILQACKLMGRTRPLRVIASPVFFAYMRAMVDLHPWAQPAGYALEGGYHRGRAQRARVDGGCSPDGASARIVGFPPAR